MEGAGYVSTHKRVRVVPETHKLPNGFELCTDYFSDNHDVAMFLRVPWSIVEVFGKRIIRAPLYREASSQDEAIAHIHKSVRLWREALGGVSEEPAKAAPARPQLRAWTTFAP